jgi:hypothetical protein
LTPAKEPELKPRSTCLAIICSLFVIVPAWAHHSHGNYDMTQFKNLKGKVTEVHWNNPHSWIYLEVTGDKGQTDTWALEGASVTHLTRKGLTKESIKAGDNLTVRCHQIHDGTNGCLLGFVSVAGAVEKEFD